MMAEAEEGEDDSPKPVKIKPATEVQKLLGWRPEGTGFVLKHGTKQVAAIKPIADQPKMYMIHSGDSEPVGPLNLTRAMDAAMGAAKKRLGIDT